MFVVEALEGGLRSFPTLYINRIFLRKIVMDSNYCAKRKSDTEKTMKTENKNYM